MEHQSKKLWGDIELNQFRKNFMYQRKRIANKVQNPRIDRITFHTLRHFYGTMECHKNQGYPTCSRKAWAQKYYKHSDLHAFGEL